ncbi:MAG: hypothetical protein GX042_09945 [Bacteroidales bacterium]|nr:hypothetical protein [Bacteroidales bacterium]
MIITHLYAFGVIIGDAGEEVIPELRNQREIHSVSEEKGVNITPPEAVFKHFRMSRLLPAEALL